MFNLLVDMLYTINKVWINDSDDSNGTPAVVFKILSANQ